MKSPFKFLSPFELTDKDVFFGRDREVDNLYRMTYQSNLILVYGYSGTGKTSLIQCGLAGRFDGPQWYPFFIRKGDDINKSLHTALQGALAGDIPGDNGLVEIVEEILDEYLSPVYLIFDQFEEFFILGDPEEQAEFTRNIRALLNRELSCKVIFIIREEYLGELYRLEQALPNLFDFKLRVESMNSLRVKKVLHSSFKAFNISLGDPAGADLDEIISNLSGEKSLIQLPYLQVYLDMLWQTVFKSTNKGKDDWVINKGETFPKVDFSHKVIKDFGPMEGVLQRYMLEVEVAVNTKLKTKYPEKSLEKNAVRTVLDVFVTGEGTKRPVPFKFEKEMVLIPPRVMEKFPIENPMLTDFILELEKHRLLRIRDDNFEIAHDSLAALIDESRTEEQKRVNRIRHEIRILHQTGQHLNEKLLASYADDFPDLKLEPELELFVERSKQHVLARKREEDQRKERELVLTRQKLAVEGKARKRQRILLGLVSIVAIISIMLGVSASLKNQEILSQNLKLKQASYDNQINAAIALKNAEQYDTALVLLKELYFLAKDLSKENEWSSQLEKWQEIRNLIVLADSLSQKEEWEDLPQWPVALSYYENAHNQDIKDVQIDEKMRNFREKIKSKANQCYNHAVNICSFVPFSNAKPLFEMAAKLDPENSTYRIPLITKQCPK